MWGRLAAKVPAEEAAEREAAEKREKTVGEQWAAYNRRAESLERGRASGGGADDAASRLAALGASPQSEPYAVEAPPSVRDVWQELADGRANPFDVLGDIYSGCGESRADAERREAEERARVDAARESYCDGGESGGKRA